MNTNLLRMIRIWKICENPTCIYLSLSIAIPKVQLCWRRACGPNQKEPHFEARTAIQPEMIIEHQRHRVATLVMCEARCKLQGKGCTNQPAVNWNGKMPRIGLICQTGKKVKVCGLHVCDAWLRHAIMQIWPKPYPHETVPQVDWSHPDSSWLA